MDEQNPINACLPSHVRSRVILNRSGRPSMKNMVKFGPQPKSMVAQMLNKVRTSKTNEFDTNLSIVDINLAYKVNKDLINPNGDHNSPNSLPLTSSLRNDIKKRRLSEATDNSIEHNSQIKATDKDKNICEVIENKVNAIHVDGSHEKEIALEFAISKSTETQKTNNTKEDLTKHKQFLCDFPNCNYSCKLSSNLIKHKRVHTNDKPYLCEKCCFRSNFINSLKAHKRTHTAERPYQCVHCSYKCNSSSNLKKHCLHRHYDCYVNTDKP